MTPVTRNGRKWRADEDAALVTMYKNGVDQEQIARALGRTQPGIRNRLGALRKEGTLGPDPAMWNIAAAQPGTLHIAATQVVTTDAQGAPSDVAFETMLWYVKTAWTEGHTVLVPSLGATFQKPQTGS